MDVGWFMLAILLLLGWGWRSASGFYCKPKLAAPTGG